MSKYDQMTNDEIVGKINEIKARLGDKEFWRIYAQVNREAELKFQTGYPDKKRGNWGDKNPCHICGKYGYTTAHGSANLVVCREHKEWFNAEVERCKVTKDGAS